MKMKIFSALLFFGLVFVLSSSVKARHSEFFESEGDRDPPPPFVCKEILPPKINDEEVEKGTLDFGLKEKYYGGPEDNQKTFIVFVSFSDQTIEGDTSEEEKKAEESLVTGTNSVTNYLDEISVEKMQKITIDILSGWVKLPKTAEEYGVNDLDTFLPEEVLLDSISAIDDDVDLSSYARIVIFMEGNHGFAMSSQGKWNGVETNDGNLLISICWFWTDDISSQYKLRHEFLHTLGLRHTGSMVLGDDDYCNRLCQEITKGENTKVIAKCTTYEYWNSWDIMGSGNGYTFMHNINNLWPDEARVYAPKESGYVTLIPRSSSKEGFKMIRFEGKDNQGSKMTIYAEYYAKVEGTLDISGDKSYVLLYFTDEDELLNGDSVVLFREERENEGSITYSPLNLKETPFCDSRNGINIELISEDGNEAELQITLSCPEEKSPAVSVFPDYIQTMSGENVMTEISVTNEMALGCGTRTVNVEASLPDANWSAVFSPSSTLELGPGEAGTITAAIWVPETAFANSYGATFKATDQDSGLSGEASMTIEVLRPTPIPTPVPTPVSNKEMILWVEINEVKAEDNDIIIVSKGDWVRVRASTFDWYDEEIMENLMVDKITCQIKNTRGKTKYYKEQENSSGSSFVFKAKRRGQFDVEVVAYKEGYETASFQAKFKVE